MALFISLLWFSCIVYASSGTKRYTYTLQKTAGACPTLAPTKSLNPVLASASSSGPTFTAYANNAGSVIPQVLAVDGKNRPIVFQTHNTSQIIIHLPKGQSAIIDKDGAHLWTADCGQELHLPVPHLPSVVNSSGKKRNVAVLHPADEPTGELFPRATKSNVSVTVQFLDQCSSPVVGHHATAICAVIIPGIDYDQPTSVPLTGDSSGNYVGSCTYPGTTDDEKKCEETVKKILDYPTTGLLGQFTNFQGDLRILQNIISRGFVADAIAAAAAAFEISALATAIGVLGIYQGIISSGGDDLIASRICHAWNDVYLQVDAQLDTGSATQVNAQSSQPFTAVSATQVVSLSAVSCSPTSTPTNACAAYVCDGPHNCVDESCTCFGDNNKPTGICASNFPCDSTPQCSSSLECGAGEFCATNTCCARSGIPGSCIPKNCAASPNPTATGRGRAKVGKHGNPSGLMAAGPRPELKRDETAWHWAMKQLDKVL